MAEVQTDYYEEMFKEITKKFYYGDDEILDTNEAMEKTEHEPIQDTNDFKLDTDNENSSFSNDMASLPNGYESRVDVSLQQLSKFTAEEENWVCSDEALTWTSSSIASYSATQKLFRCNECECIGFLSRIAEHWLGSHANLRVFQCSQCPYASAWARCVKMHLARQHHEICPEATSDEELQKLMKVSPVLEEVTKYLEKLKSKLEISEESPPSDEAITEQSTELVDTTQNIDNTTTEMYTSATIKRYNCEHCSYATDRKDLFTRHENIHREDKPFQCNVCQKQFNRADHIKKHFIRMHRDHEYLLSNVRRAKTQSRTGNTNIKQKEKTIILSTPTLVQETLPESTLQSIIQRHIPTTTVSAERTQPTITAQIIHESHPSVIQSTHMHEFLQQSDTEQMDISFFGTHTLLIPADAKQAKSKQPRTKKYNIEKNVQCSYCTWTGADNWCLKRHLNTHLKPYGCSMCEYKAARSERLTTHIFRVHNKRACTKCNFLADDLIQLSAHQAENHK